MRSGNLESERETLGTEFYVLFEQIEERNTVILVEDCKEWIKGELYVIGCGRALKCDDSKKAFLLSLRYQIPSHILRSCKTIIILILKYIYIYLY